MIDITQAEIMKEWNVDNTDKPLVSIRCITYNHEPYIALALDSFLLQKTSFPFEVIVHDDASTDETANIIHEYEAKFPKIIKPIYETENQYSKHDGSLLRIMNAACKGKYIAICEGDDYWIDENKLQIQVDFLENNPEYGICYTKVRRYKQAQKKIIDDFGEKVTNFEDLLKNGNKIPTLSVCFRTEYFNKYYNEIQPSKRGWKMGDYPLWLFLSHESKIKFINRVTGVYRILEESTSHSCDFNKKLDFAKSAQSIVNFFSNKYGVTVESHSDAYILFYIYIQELKNDFNSEYVKKLRQIYKDIDKHTFKLWVYKTFSFSKLFWKII